MELVALGKEILQNIAEHVASYRVGQSMLRRFDKALWVVEKTARWAVPPPLDVDERPQPELIRPLPWLFFLTLMITLRLTRESLSLVNLILGKPPLRSVDVVAYIQSKRRYLRTLKYQGNRMLRARSAGSQSKNWRGWKSLFEFTMCFRRSYNYGNNNSTNVNNEEVLVVKRKRSSTNPNVPAPSDVDAMERLIDQMMVELNAESDEDSSYTLTNATSLRSIESEAASDDNLGKKTAPSPTDTDSQSEKTMHETPNSINETENNESVSSFAKSTTTENITENETQQNEEKGNKEATNIEENENKEATNNKDKENNVAMNNENKEEGEVMNNEDKEEQPETKETVSVTSPPPVEKKLTAKEQTLRFLQSEASQSSRKSSKKIANGQTAKGAPKKLRGASDKRGSDVPVIRIIPATPRHDNMPKGHRKPLMK